MSVTLTQPATIPGLLAATVAERTDQPALGSIRGGILSWLSWGEVSDAVHRQASTLRRLGVQPGDRVAQFAGNSEAWILADLAIQLAGAVHVPVHGTLSPRQAAEQVAHAEAALLLAADGSRQADLDAIQGSGKRVLTHAELADLAATVEDADLDDSQTRRDPDDLATILYTSGTTGDPLGVMLTQQNLVSNALAVCERVASQSDDLRLGLLPLSHIYARTCDLYVWILRGSRLVLGESRETLLRDCQLVRPTVLNCVPYVYQKIADGLRRHNPHATGEQLRGLLGGAVRRCYCGGAALAPDVERFFAERGLPVLCGYGLSEASPVVTMTRPDECEPTTVGKPLGNLEVRLAADGEILVRGPSVMPGYWKNPEATDRTVKDGWLQTGDLGEWTTAGNLKIVGRKKELLVLATGKKAAPTAIEQRLCASSLIDAACVVGDGRKFLAALIVPNAQATLTGDAHAAIRDEINRCLADAAECEQIRAFTLLDRPFSLELGEMTPKFSLRRMVIEERFAPQIEAMYAPR